MYDKRYFNVYGLSFKFLDYDTLPSKDKNYVPQHKKTPVYALGIKIFGQEVFHQNALERIQRLIMKMIKSDRDGEVIAERFLLKNLCQMMIEISLKEIYEPYFERRFLQESREYFAKEAADFFEKATATDYLKRVLMRLKSERELAERCFDPGTVTQIEDVIKQTMINAYKQQLIDVCNLNNKCLLVYRKKDRDAL